MGPSYSEAVESDLAQLQGPITETPLEREGIASAKRDSTIHPAHIAILLVLKRIRLIVCQSAIATNRSLPDVSTLAVRPRVSDKGTILARWHRRRKHLGLGCRPRSRVAYARCCLEEVLDEGNLCGLGDRDGVCHGVTGGDHDRCWSAFNQY